MNIYQLNGIPYLVFGNNSVCLKYENGRFQKAAAEELSYPAGSTMGSEELDQFFDEETKRELDWYRKAEALAKKAHAGQTDKSGKDYYTVHVHAVSDMALEWGLYAATAALLHDTLEDTSVTEEELRALFPPAIVDAVVCLTRKPEEEYMDYVRRCKHNAIAKPVKMCDLANNMDLDRIKEVTPKDQNRILKYARAYAFLMKPD